MILAICTDLFFKLKIEETARQLNQKIEFSHSISEVLEKVSHGNIQKVLVDLNNAQVNGLELIQKIRSFDQKLEVFGFFSHVDVKLKNEALKAGFSKVVPRSDFSKNLPSYLKG